MACEMAGATAEIAHTKSLLNQSLRLHDYDLLMLPGGFSFGDELGAAKAFANRLTYSGELRSQLLDFVNAGKCIFGVCNGFQLLVKLRLLHVDQEANDFQFSLANNDSCRFEDRWVHHTVFSSPCVFTKGIEKLYLPIRHGEGKFIAKDPALIESLSKNNQIVLKYVDNPNGSQDDIAGICDPTGRIFGMMAHPEAALMFTNHPHWTKIKEQAARRGEELPTKGEGLRIFENAVNYMKDNR